MLARNPGRMRKRLAALLSEKLGVPINPEDIGQNKGPYCVGLDVARWSVRVRLDNRNVNVYSWDTMTDCLRHPIAFRRDRDGLGIEVSYEAESHPPGRPLIEVLDA